MAAKIIKSLRLSDLEEGESGVIVKTLGYGAFRKRIIEMGFVKGKSIKVIKRAPFRDPIEYEILDYKVSLRKSEAEQIQVVAIAEANEDEHIYEGVIDEETLKVSQKEKSKTINVAFVGNPNSGKTTIFNFASGSKERVGNYSGVTVDAKTAQMEVGDYKINITDLPGTYSITEYSSEELYVREHILNNTPDIVVNIVDASNLERNLFLTTQLIDMNIKVVIALNMFDELQAKNADFDYAHFGAMVGIPVVPTVGSKGKGVNELMGKIIQVYEDEDNTVRHIHINYGNSIENSIKTLQKEIRKNVNITDKFSSRYLSIKLIENDNSTKELLRDCPNFNTIVNAAEIETKSLEKEYKDKIDAIIANAKYGFITGALAETYKEGNVNRHLQSNKIDKYLTHKFWGFPIFLAFMWLTFQTTFSLGKYPMEAIEKLVSFTSDILKTNIPEGALKDLLIDGIIGGVGGVIVFLPNILILFFFISLMEDSGYMARASFIMDKLMHKIGLHGKSFIPILMGFGCNVPAIMATRSLENKKDRLLTMLIIPFMSCSARLPVYVLIISAIFVSYQGAILLAIYSIGILVAIVSALIFKSTLFAKQDAPFVMELPPYRLPTLKNTTIHMWDKGSQYIRKMGTIILSASILIWALGYFPREANFSRDYDKEITQIQNNKQIVEKEKTGKIDELELDKEAERLENSFIGRIGHSLAPVIKPLGFDWKIGVSIVTGVAAKEIVVSTMGILYQADKAADESSDALKDKLRNQKYTSGERKGENVFNATVAFSLMVFVLIYFPCMAVIAAIKRESNWKWALFAMVYTTAVAWVLAFITKIIGELIFK